MDTFGGFLTRRPASRRRRRPGQRCEPRISDVYSSNPIGIAGESAPDAGELLLRLTVLLRYMTAPAFGNRACAARILRSHRNKHTALSLRPVLQLAT